MCNITSKYFSFFNNKPPASWVVHITTEFLTCYSCLNYSSMILVNNNLCWKLVLSLELPTVFDERFKVTSAPFFITDFTFVVLY